MRPSCWYGRTCPFEIMLHDQEAADAYRFARFAVTPQERHDAKTNQERIEWTYSQESVQFACWLHALDTREDRLRAFDLIATVGVWSKRGQEWETLRRIALDRIELEDNPTLDDFEIIELDDDLL